MDRFDAISPLDFRYIGGDAKLHAALAPYLSENGYVTHKAEVEGHLAKALADAGAIELAVAERIAAVCANVDPAAVAEEERKTRHDVRALVNVIVAKLPRRPAASCTSARRRTTSSTPPTRSATAA